MSSNSSRRRSAVLNFNRRQNCAGGSNTVRRELPLRGISTHTVIVMPRSRRSGTAQNLRAGRKATALRLGSPGCGFQGSRAASVTHAAVADGISIVSRERAERSGFATGDLAPASPSCRNALARHGLSSSAHSSGRRWAAKTACATPRQS